MLNVCGGGCSKILHYVALPQFFRFGWFSVLGKIVEFRVGEELFVRKCVRHWESGSLVWAAFQGRVFGFLEGEKDMGKIGEKSSKAI